MVFLPSLGLILITLSGLLIFYKSTISSWIGLEETEEEKRKKYLFYIVAASIGALALLIFIPK
jgi:hypothetical protein